MAMKEYQYVSGYQTSDGIIHVSHMDAGKAQLKLNIIEVICANYKDAEVLADELLKRYVISERTDWRDPADVAPPPPMPTPTIPGDSDDDIPF